MQIARNKSISALENVIVFMVVISKLLFVDQELKQFRLIESFNIAWLILFSSVGVCKMYEEHLKRMNPNSPSITYDISQLFDFIDDLADLSCLV